MPPPPATPTQTTLYVYRFNPPALVAISENLEPRNEIPFSIPPNCGLFDVFSPAAGSFLAIELSCPNGQTVLFLDTNSGAVIQPIRDSDSHFLAWTLDGDAAYLKVDSLGSPRVVRASTAGETTTLSVPEFTYDLATTTPGVFTFTVSRGLGQGSALYLTEGKGCTFQLLYADPDNYISFARFSPDGTQVAFIKVPDTQTPFTVGQLWVMDRDGSQARELAEADAGHGYAANWSPDGTRIAFVARENPADAQADRLSEALISNVYVVDLQTGTLKQITHLEQGRVETPHWSPQGNMLAFHAVIDDRMEVQIADLGTGHIHLLTTESTCCPAWMRK